MTTGNWSENFMFLTVRFVLGVNFFILNEPA